MRSHPIMSFALEHEHTVVLCKVMNAAETVASNPWVQQTLSLIGRANSIDGGGE